MKRLLASLAIVFAVSALGAPEAEARRADKKGLLRVIVVDEAGKYVPDARVYLYAKQKKRFLDGAVKDGVLLMEIPVGKYRIYSAVSRKNADFVDRFASHEAHVRVNGEEPASVLLTLKNTQEPVTYLSESTLKKIGLSPELVQHLN